jgi:hypothetical protein
MDEDQKPIEDQKTDFVLIYDSKNNPFKTEGGAKKAMTAKGLSPKEYEPVAITGTITPEDPFGEANMGWVIRKKRPKTKIPDAEFYRVRFSPKSSADQDDDVMLTVNGESLIIQRDVETIIPKRFRECADHARFPKYMQLPDQPRKIVAWVQFFPYQIIGPSTKEEYLEMREEGTRVTHDRIAREGYHYDPQLDQ